MIPFPHFLEVPCWRNDHKMRVVSDVAIKPGNVLYCPIHKMNFQVEFITAARPARGDWSAYPKHPTYYECLASGFIQQQLFDDKPPERYEPKQSQVFPV
jgi:hypothetical protein